MLMHWFCFHVCVPFSNITCYITDPNSLHRIYNDKKQQCLLKVNPFTFLLHCLDVPGVPDGPLEVTDVKADSVMLSWKPPKSDGGSPVTKYLIEKCDTKKNRWTAVGEVDAQTLSYNVQKLLEDQPYLFRVSAINAEGQGKPLLTDSETAPKKPAGNVTKNIKVAYIYISILGGGCGEGGTIYTV